MAVSTIPLASAVSGSLPDGSAPSGSVIQVVSTNFAGTFSTNSGSWTNITGFNVSITPSNANNKILIQLMVQIGSGSGWTGLNLIRQVSGQSDVKLNIGSTAASNRQPASFGNDQPSGNHTTEGTNVESLVYLDSPNTTSTVTYQLQGSGRWGTTDSTLYINRPGSWNDDSISGRVPASNIIVMEIVA